MLKLFIKENKWAFLGAIIYGLIAGGAASLLLISIHQSLEITPQVSITLIGLFIIACIGYVIFYILSDQTLVKLAEKLTASLKLDLLKTILNAPIAQVETTGTSNIITIIQNDVDGMGRIIDSTPKAIVDFFIFIGCLCYLAYLSVYIFIGLLVSSGIIIALYYFINKLVRKKFSISRQTLTIIYQNIQSFLFGIKELQLSTKKQTIFYTDHLEKPIHSYREYMVYSNTILAFLKRSIEVMLYLIIGAMIFGIPHIYPSINPSTLTGFILTTLFLIKPIESLLGFIGTLPLFSISMNEIKTLTENLTAIHNLHPIASPTLPQINQLEIKMLSYTYYSIEIDDSFTLGPINTTINSSEITYIIGGNGSGKTTLGKLLCGLYFPEKGSFSINQSKISNDNITWFRNHFSVIFSDFHLFDHFLDLQNLPKEKVQHYIDAFHLTQKVTYKNGQFSTLKLSTGQRKRLALISACLQDRPIYIFDEWASDQDPEFKKIFYNEILPDLKQQNKMVIVITHDDFYFNKADRIIRLRNGKLVEKK
jgi:putative ATP-binding cassette transporter